MLCSISLIFLLSLSISAFVCASSPRLISMDSFMSTTMRFILSASVPEIAGGLLLATILPPQVNIECPASTIALPAADRRSMEAAAGAAFPRNTHSNRRQTSNRAHPSAPRSGARRGGCVPAFPPPTPRLLPSTLSTLRNSIAARRSQRRAQCPKLPHRAPPAACSRPLSERRIQFLSVAFLFPSSARPPRVRYCLG